MPYWSSILILLFAFDARSQCPDEMAMLAKTQDTAKIEASALAPALENLETRARDILHELEGKKEASAVALLQLRELVRENQATADQMYAIGKKVFKESKAASPETELQTTAEAYHDVRNLLGATASLAAAHPELAPDGVLMPGTKIPSSELRPILQSAVDGLVKARQIVRDVERGMPAAIHPKSVSARSLFRDLAQLTAHFPKDLRIHWDAPHALPSVKGDDLALSRVLLNLCTNAKQAMPKGGDIYLEASIVHGDTIPTTEGGQVKIKDAEGKTTSPDYVMIMVRDNGPGIPEENMNRIFSGAGFTTRKGQKGQGLGLSSALNVVAEHGGMVRAESEVGKGTQFRIYLPVYEPLPSDVLPEKIEAGTVIIADDQESNHMIPKVAIGRDKPSLSVHSGNAAIAAVEKDPHAVKAVLLDMQMPGYTADETVRELRALNPKLRILVLSGNDQPIAGTDGHLTKPVNVQQLRDLLAQP